jgi:hypothetical protein
MPLRLESPQEQSYPLGLFDELGVGYRLVLDDPSARDHLEQVFVEQLGAGLLIDPWFVHQRSRLPSLPTFS